MKDKHRKLLARKKPMVPPSVLTKERERNKEAQQEIEYLHYLIMILENELAAAKQPAVKETKLGSGFHQRCVYMYLIQYNVSKGAIPQLCRDGKLAVFLLDIRWTI